jgi:hypothetical protein
MHSRRPPSLWIAASDTRSVALGAASAPAAIVTFTYEDPAGAWRNARLQWEQPRRQAVPR